MRAETDAKFLVRLIQNSNLPSTQVVVAQLDWVLTMAREKCPRIEPAPYVANGHKTLRETVDDLRKALKTVERIRARLVKWSVADNDEARFFRRAIDAALHDSLLVPEEIVSMPHGTYGACRVDRLLPCVPDGLDDELHKISTYAQKGQGYIRYDPNERMIVQLLMLVFETSGRKVATARKGSPMLSPFQKVCVALFERAGFAGCAGVGRQPTSLSNLSNRVRDHVTAGRKNKRLHRIKVVMATRPVSIADVPTVMEAWFDWLAGLDIPEKTGTPRQ